MVSGKSFHAGEEMGLENSTGSLGRRGRRTLPTELVKCTDGGIAPIFWSSLRSSFQGSRQRARLRIARAFITPGGSGRGEAAGRPERSEIGASGEGAARSSYWLAARSGGRGACLSSCIQPFLPLPQRPIYFIYFIFALHRAGTKRTSSGPK